MMWFLLVAVMYITVILFICYVFRYIREGVGYEPARGGKR